MAAEYLVLFGIGIIAIMLHARLRTPLNIPGHHGLEFMAILMAGRTASRIPWASSISSLGIGFILLFPLFGFKDPFMGINYMLPGFIIDIFYNLSRQFKWQLFIMAFVAGIAYFTIPLSRLFISAFVGYPYSSFIKYGYIIPMISFFAFGMAGGFVGTGLTQAVVKFLRKKS
jgi:hypothetical protein